MAEKPHKMKPDDKSSVREDEVLRRMLNTPPTPHKPIGESRESKVASKLRRKKERGAH